MRRSFPWKRNPAKKISMVTGADKRRGAIAAAFVRSKGSTDQYVVSAMSQGTEPPGYYAVILQSDGEPSMTDFIQAVHDTRSKPSIMRTTPRGSKGRLELPSKLIGR